MEKAPILNFLLKRPHLKSNLNQTQNSEAQYYLWSGFVVRSESLKYISLSNAFLSLKLPNSQCQSNVIL